MTDQKQNNEEVENKPELVRSFSEKLETLLKLKSFIYPHSDFGSVYFEK